MTYWVDPTDDPDVGELGNGADEPQPLGPRADSVFPSLPAAQDQTPVVAPVDVVNALAIPLARNIFTLTPVPAGWSQDDLVERSRAVANDPSSGGLSEFDQPEEDRIFAVSEEFVGRHARRIAKGFAIKVGHPSFDVGTIVISEEPVPMVRVRHAKFQWAISPSGGVVELKNARPPVSHLEPIRLRPNPQLASPHQGDDSDVAFLLAYVCDLLGANPQQSIAGTGGIGNDPLNVLPDSDVDILLDAAKVARMAHVVLPFKNGKVTGMHDGVRYWPVRDSAEAIFALFSALADEVVIPNLYRRAMTKEAYSWSSLVLILLAICAYQLAAVVGSRPPVGFVGFLLGVVVLLTIGSFVLVHRFWRLDR